MSQKNGLQDALSLVEKLPEEPRDYMNRLLDNAPLSLLESLKIKYIEKDVVFIEEKTEVKWVYFLLDGFVHALENRIEGIIYDYMSFRPVKMFGSMEVLLEIDTYQTSLATASECTFFMISKREFEKWIQTDTNALLMETKSMGTYLLEQSKNERLYLLLQGRDRLFLVFMQEYEKNADESGKLHITRTRQELSDCSGLSIRTINRALKTMREDGYIFYNRQNIVMNKEHYEQMRRYLSQIVEK